MYLLSVTTLARESKHIGPDVKGRLFAMVLDFDYNTGNLTLRELDSLVSSSSHVCAADIHISVDTDPHALQQMDCLSCGIIVEIHGIWRDTLYFIAQKCTPVSNAHVFDDPEFVAIVKEKINLSKWVLDFHK